MSPVPGQRARGRWTGRGLTRDRHSVPQGPLLDLEKAKAQRRAGMGPHGGTGAPTERPHQSTHETRTSNRPVQDLQCANMSPATRHGVLNGL